MELPRYLNMAEIATALSCCERHVRKMCQQGSLPSIRVGKLWRVEAKEFHAWLERGGTAGDLPSKLPSNPT